MRMSMVRLIFSILFLLNMLLPAGANSVLDAASADGFQANDLSSLLIFIAIIELLFIVIFILQSRSRYRSSEAALHQKRKELRESEEKFSKIFRQGQVAVTLATAEDRKYVDVNQAYERLTGFSREEVLGRSALDIGLWVDPDESQYLTKKLLLEGYLRDVEFQFRRKDGAVRTAQASAELIEIGSRQCVLGVIADITDRKQAERALVESEKRFRLMADSAPVLMWLTDPDQHCTDVNKEWLRFTGRSIQEELGQGWIESIHSDDRQVFFAAYTNASDKRKCFAIEHRLRRFDGEYRWLRNNAVPRFFGDASFVGYIGCCVDITDEKEAKADRAEFSGRLIHAQEEERTRIARELHDDINQRLALLANGLERVGHLNSDWRNLEQTTELHNLWRLTNEIATDIQHLSHQLHPAKLHYLGLAAAVRDLCHEFSRQHEIEVQCTVRNLPHDLDESISLNLFRIIQESLRNVAKHSRANHVAVELTYQSALLRLRVSDDGVGFNPVDTKNNEGLGLVSMRERMRSAGGQFRICSRLSFGTQVEGTVFVPQKHASIS